MKQVPNLSRGSWTKLHTKRILKNVRGKKGISLSYLRIGLINKYSQIFTYTQFEAVRRAIVRCLRPRKKKNLKNFKHIRNLPNVKKKKKVVSFRGKPFILRPSFFLPLTRKPNQVRMGKEKDL